MNTDAVSEIRLHIAQKRAELDALERTLAILTGEPAPPSAGRNSTVRRGTRTRLVLELLAEAGDAGMTRSELAAALGEDSPSERDLLSNGLAYLRRQGRVRRSDEGRWLLPS